MIIGSLNDLAYGFGVGVYISNFLFLVLYLVKTEDLKKHLIFFIAPILFLAVICVETSRAKPSWGEWTDAVGMLLGLFLLNTWALFPFTKQVFKFLSLPSTSKENEYMVLLWQACFAGFLVAYPFLDGVYSAYFKVEHMGLWISLLFACLNVLWSFGFFGEYIRKEKWDKKC